MTIKQLRGFVALAALAMAASRTIATGADILVRTSETIDAKECDGCVFTEMVDRDATDANANLAIPQGSNAESDGSSKNKRTGEFIGGSAAQSAQTSAVTGSVVDHLTVENTRTRVSA